MGSVFGKNLKLTVFGESHGSCVGATIDNFPAGVEIDYDNINNWLTKRRPSSSISTTRVEKDEYKIISGIFNNKSTGAPLTLIIENKEHNSKDYNLYKSVMRPSHADYSAYIKYDGYNDYRGGGHFSGRLSAPIVAVGAVCNQVLNTHGIEVIYHIKSVGEIESHDILDIENINNEYLNSNFPSLDFDIMNRMMKLIETTKYKGDSIGGSVQVLIKGLKAGVGNPMFDSIESVISHAMFSIGGVKAIEFGKGIEMAFGHGSSYNDMLRINGGEVQFLSNNNGGINGGISNGCDICFTVYFKPTPTIMIKQQTIDIVSKENVELTNNGRHDPCIVHRASHVVGALTSFTILDMLGGYNGH